jgi:hypothetical protein
MATWLTVYLGNNAATPSGVKDTARVAATAGPLHALLHRNRLYLLQLKAFQYLRSAGRDCERLALASGADSQSLEDFYRAGARVSPDEYEANLREIVRVVRNAEARPILLKVPMNLVWPPSTRPYGENVLQPEGFWSTVKIDVGYLMRAWAGRPACLRRSFLGHPYLCLVTLGDLQLARLPDPEELSRQAEDPARSERDRLRASHNGAVWKLAEGDAAAALARLEAVAASAAACRCVEPNRLAWVHHNIGVVRLLLGQPDAAFDAMLESRRIWPFAMSPAYAERFDRVVEDFAVEWVDLPRVFAETDPLFRGSALIHDWVHPSERGNAVIAEALARKLREGQLAGRPASAAEP